MTTENDSQQFPHLGKKAAVQALLSADERIAIIQEGTWINLEAPKNVIAKLEAMLSAPRITKPPCLLLIGDSDSGKSSILSEPLHPSLAKLRHIDPKLDVYTVSSALG
jgi:polynucleotide 5'-kinase involved in rRNA processing